jgi:hypothetical protein
VNYDTDTPEGLENSMIWTHKTLSLLKPGGAWAIPRSGTLVYPDQENMTARVVFGAQPERTLIKVLDALGYTVTVEQQP